MQIRDSVALRPKSDTKRSVLKPENFFFSLCSRFYPNDELVVLPICYTGQMTRSKLNRCKDLLFLQAIFQNSPAYVVRFLCRRKRESYSRTANPSIKEELKETSKKIFARRNESRSKHLVQNCAQEDI